MSKNKIILSLLLIGLLSLAIITQAYKEPAQTDSNARHFTLSYTLDLESVSGSSQLDIWLPLPPSNDRQQSIAYTVNSNLEYSEYVDPDHGNRILHLRGQSLTNKIEVQFEINRTEVDVLSVIGRTESREVLNRYLKPSRLIPIDGPIAAEAATVINSNSSSLTNARTLYDHLFETMRYDKSGTGWGHGDAVYACDARSGNCTDIHSLYIGMLRSQGIPARFIIGFPLPEDKKTASIGGYHCWAEFWVEDKGWIPVDISEAIKHPEKKEYLFGHLDKNRVAFTTGRDISLGSSAAGERLNYLIYPFILVDGVVLDGNFSEFSFSDIKTKAVSSGSM